MSGVPKYWAHSDAAGLAPDEPGAKWQALSDHLKQVGDLAERLGLAAGGSPEFGRRARAAGLLHDLGKYSDDFQKLLRGEVKRAPHSIFGAAISLAKARALDVGFAVAGHHGGMPDPVDLKDRVAKASSAAEALWERAGRDCPELAECFESETPLLGSLERCDPLAFDLHCRVAPSAFVPVDPMSRPPQDRRQLVVCQSTSEFYTLPLYSTTSTTSRQSQPPRIVPKSRFWRAKHDACLTLNIK